jgi:hypothetical protein
MAPTPTRTRRWTRVAYDRLIDVGFSSRASISSCSAAAAAQLYGSRYREITVLGPGTSIAPLVRPDAAVEVAALLPRPGYDVR